MQKDKETSTKSLWCSAYLLYRNHKLVRFDLVTPYKGYFVFNKSKRLEMDIAEYYETNPQVPIKDYLRQYDALRDLVMHSKRKANRDMRRLT
jgi:uncharacterized protein DUF5659